MKPLDYLTEEGEKIFYSILELIPSDITQETDTYELSMLANYFDLYAQAALNIKNNKTGYQQQTPNNYSQITADVTMMDKAGAYIIKNSGKFGLNPEAREKLKEVWQKKKKKKSGMDKILANGSNTNVA